MIDTTELDGIVVLRSHLEEIEQVLQWANGHFAALDLTDNYRQGRPNYKPSRMTNLTSRALVRLKGYLDVQADESISTE